MNKLIMIASMALTVIMFASGHTVSLLVTVVGMSLNLPGPLAESPMAWVWLVISLLILFGVSLLFCRWFARKVEKKIVAESTFE